MDSTGIGPEVFAFIGEDGGFTGSTPSASDIEFYNQSGFYVYSGYG
jgi:mannosyl-oligosaccharide alpha-1,2-mannosidase